tara:strand:- start:49 stop:369 length:321 start_codon:yes stop_codon:yes gene_type:complete
MAIENVGKFMSIVAENEEIQTRMVELLQQGSKMEALIVLAKEYGYEFDAEEALTWGKAAASNEDGELSEQDLEAVAGGAGFSFNDVPVSLFFEHAPNVPTMIKTGL